MCCIKNKPKHNRLCVPPPCDNRRMACKIKWRNMKIVVGNMPLRKQSEVLEEDTSVISSSHRSHFITI